MKSLRSLLALLLLALSFTLAGCPSLSTASSKAEHPTVADLVQSIQTALRNTANEPAGWLPPFTKAKIQIQTVTGQKTSGGVDILFVSIKGYDDRAETQELDIVLEKPKAFGAENVDRLNLASTLETLIRSARDSVKESYPGQGGAPTLATKEVDIQVGFSISRGSSGGLKLEKTPVGLSAGIDKSNKTAHAITLVYGG